MSDRIQWLKDRRTCLTATDMTILMGVSPYGSQEDILAEKLSTDEPEDFLPSNSMAVGIILEPLILAELGREQWGHKLVRNKAYPHLGATPDAWEMGMNGVEVKTTWQRWSEIPDRVIVQTHVCMMATGYTRWDLAYYKLAKGEQDRVLVQKALGRPFGLEGKVEIKTIKFDPKLGDAIDQKAREWWDKHVVLGLPL